jgi:hypothetical protein
MHDKKVKDEESAANPNRTQVGDATEQDWQAVGDEVRGAAETAGSPRDRRPSRRPDPETPLQDEEGRSQAGHPSSTENFRGDTP